MNTGASTSPPSTSGATPAPHKASTRSEPDQPSLETSRTHRGWPPARLGRRLCLQLRNADRGQLDDARPDPSWAPGRVTEGRDHVDRSHADLGRPCPAAAPVEAGRVRGPAELWPHPQDPEGLGPATGLHPGGPGID